MTALRSALERPLSAAIAVVVAVAALVISTADPASAHSGNQSYLYIDVFKTSVSGRIEAPVSDINEVIGLDIDGTDEEVSAALDANLAKLGAYFGAHLEIGAGGQTWPIEFTAVERFFSNLPEAEDNYAIVRFQADVGEATVPRALDVRFDPFFDEIEGRDGLLLIGNDWDAGVLDNGHEVYSQFSARSRTQNVDLGATGWFKNFKASTKLGVNHIKTGPDHMLFILVLLLPSVMVFAKRWRPSPSFRAALWKVLKIVTMFTLAHTITFSLAGLEIIPIPSPRLVEGVIAISIAAAALHNLRPVFENREALIAFAFGLFHGLGFASLVQDLDVPRSTQLVSLAGRNVGIEIGQTAVVLAMFPTLYLLRRTRYYRSLFVGLSILLTVVSIGWMIERVFEKELGISDWVDPVVRFPRALIVMVIVTAAAGVTYLIEKKRNHLVDIAPSQPESPTQADALASI